MKWIVSLLNGGEVEVSADSKDEAIYKAEAGSGDKITHPNDVKKQ